MQFICFIQIFDKLLNDSVKLPQKFYSKIAMKRYGERNKQYPL